MSGWWMAHGYDLLRALHIIAVIAWMAGIMYLPRLFAYHTEATPDSEMAATFTVMERKLLRIIINPAMTLAFIFGFALIWYNATHRNAGWGFLLQPWMITKLAGVVFLAGWTEFLSGARRRFEAGTNTRSGKFWRMTNELPFLAAIVMVLAVTLEWGAR